MVTPEVTPELGGGVNVTRTARRAERPAARFVVRDAACVGPSTGSKVDLINRVRDRIPSHNQDHAANAIKAAIAKKLIFAMKGPNNSLLHYVAEAD